MKVIELHQPLNEVLLLLIAKSLQNLNYNINNIDKKQYSISASSNASIFSWGENINIHLKENINNHSIVYISSTPKAQLIDWGKSKNNEEKISENIINLRVD